MAVQIQLRNDTTANWELNNPVLALGEFGLDTDLKQFKIGNGFSAWNDLPYGGIEGQSAYEVAINNGFTGTEQEWLDSYLDRTNHIGTQSINTIENLQIELNNKLNFQDVGNLVQPYDSQTVTYSQVEKDKLANIQSGAEVNVQSDWNATEGGALILNKPVLGDIASRSAVEFASASQGIKADTAVQPVDIANFETTTQLNNRDIANRDRSNHTGTQSISTVENLQQALDSKQPAGDYATNTDLTNGLNTKEPNIIQGTVNQYWRGDKSWQTLDKNAVGLSNVDNVSDLNKPISTATQSALNLKQDTLISGTNIKTIEGQSLLGSGNIDLTKSDVGLNNIDNTSDLNKPISTATQSALNLKADLNSPTFTGQLILPNNSRINNIEHFYQTTKPITRGNGSALVVGDRWWKTDEGTEWFWNGTYWLSTNLFFIHNNAGNSSITISSFTEGGVISLGTMNSSNNSWGVIFGENSLKFIDCFALRAYSSNNYFFDANNKFDLYLQILANNTLGETFITTVDSPDKIYGNEQPFPHFGGTAYYKLNKAISIKQNFGLANILVIRNIIGSPILSPAIPRWNWSFGIRGIHP